MTGGGKPNWESLMRAAQQGDQRAYRRILSGIAPIVRAWAFRRWGAHNDVEDLVQEVLLSVHTSRHTYDPGRPFLPWLKAIVVFRMADMARRHGRTTANEITMDPNDETFLAFATNLPDESLGDPELLRKAIADLPPGQRQAVELLKMRELSLKEASQASGQSIPALKVAMHRALKTMRQIMTRKATDQQ